MPDGNSGVHEQLLGERAARWYDRLRPELEKPENLGRFVFVDSETGDFMVGDNEDDAEHRFVTVFGTTRPAVLFHIGSI